MSLILWLALLMFSILEMYSPFYVKHVSQTASFIRKISQLRKWWFRWMAFFNNVQKYPIVEIFLGVLAGRVFNSTGQSEPNNTLSK